jgi:DNA topoisomerase-1
MKKLVIVESPAKIKSIKKYLGSGYEVKASKGHIIDLPKSDLGVDVEKNFKPKYVVTKRAALAELKKAYQNADGLLIATDPDREGEAIGWHVANKLGLITDSGNIKKGQSLQRIVFTSITKNAVQDALKNPRKLDQGLFDAQQARRVLDRLVGYKLSPLLWKKIRFGLSAGRVQSVAVRLVVEREEEREKFVAEEYWSIKAWTEEKKAKSKLEIKYELKPEEEVVKESEKTARETGIEFELSKIAKKKAKVTSEKTAREIVQAVRDRQWVIAEVLTKKVKRYPKPPFTTSTLQQTASNLLGFSAKRTMSVAQKLYERGIITYMRTDSTNLAPDAISGARKVVQKLYGGNYLPDKPIYYRTKAKVAQEAHEAIRPTNFTKLPKTSGLADEALKLYRLIWQRAVASQMVPAEVESGKVIIEIDKYEFIATGQKMLFPGYLKVYPDKFQEQALPDLHQGDEVFPHKILGRQHFTQPPARYSEATLIKALESFGIGRPSTYVPTLSTIQTRKYVEKDGKYFFPTDIGKIVTDLLRDHFDQIVDYEFTAKMEDDLDNIANGEKDWVAVMKDFYEPFEKKLAKKDKEIDRETYTVLGLAPKEMKCPECGGRMNVKLGRYGRFYSCKKWPDCKGMMGEDGKTEDQREGELAHEANSDKFLNTYKDSPKTDDGRPYLLKMGRFGKFWAHPDYPKVKDARPLEYTDEINLKLYGRTPMAKDGKTKMILRNGRFGPYWAHPDYPKVKEVERINKKEVLAKKKELRIG